VVVEKILAANSPVTGYDAQTGLCLSELHTWSDANILCCCMQINMWTCSKQES